MRTHTECRAAEAPCPRAINSRGLAPPATHRPHPGKHKHLSVIPPRVVRSERAEATTRLLHYDGQVKAIGPAPCVAKRLQSLRRAVQESIGSGLVSAGCVR